MEDINAQTGQIIRKMFSPEQHEVVAHLLFKNLDDSDRIQFAVLKLSNGDVDRLRRVVERAQTDWRDTLMSAGFGEDVTEHNRWAKEYLS